MDSVVNLGKKVSESTSEFFDGLRYVPVRVRKLLGSRDTLRDRRSFTRMDAPSHVTKMNIPISYDDPERDV